MDTILNFGNTQNGGPQFCNLVNRLHDILRMPTANTKFLGSGLH